MPKYSLFTQRGERIKGSQTAKQDVDLIIQDPKSDNA